MYPRTAQELRAGAQALETAVAQDHIFDNYGPFVIYNELYEGASVIESQPYAAPASQYHAFGLERLDVVRQFFAPSAIPGAGQAFRPGGSARQER
jgi:hypothetical protein